MTAATHVGAAASEYQTDNAKPVEGKSEFHCYRRSHDLSQHPLSITFPLRFQPLEYLASTDLCGLRCSRFLDLQDMRSWKREPEKWRLTATELRKTNQSIFNVISYS